MASISRKMMITLLFAVACTDSGEKVDDSGTTPDDDTGEEPYRDEDGDGYYAEVDDCDDQDRDVNPSATETCDGLDNDCDTLIDEDVTSTFYLDDDADGYGDADAPVVDCALPAGAAAESGDCDDVDPAVNPAATETCDGLDNDCDGLTDAEDEVEGGTFTAYTDADADGYGDAAAPLTVCLLPTGFVEDSTDCDDTQATTYPGAAEICDDALDQDCDGKADEQCGCVDLNIIQFYDSFSAGATSMDGAAAELGATFTSISTFTGDFDTAYDAVDPTALDVVVVDVPGSAIPTEVLTRVETAIGAGSLVIFSYWYLGYDATTASMLGVTTDSSLGTPLPLSSAAGGTMWDLVEDLPDAIANNSADAGLNGNVLSAVDASTSETLAVFSADASKGAIVATYSGQVIVNGFLPWDFHTTDDDADGVNDMVELYVNEIMWALDCAP